MNRIAFLCDGKKLSRIGRWIFKKRFWGYKRICGKLFQKGERFGREVLTVFMPTPCDKALEEAVSRVLMERGIQYIYPEGKGKLEKFEEIFGGNVWIYAIQDILKWICTRRGLRETDLRLALVADFSVDMRLLIKILSKNIKSLLLIGAETDKLARFSEEIMREFGICALISEKLRNLEKGILLINVSKDGVFAREALRRNYFFLNMSPKKYEGVHCVNSALFSVKDGAVYNEKELEALYLLRNEAFDRKRFLAFQKEIFLEVKKIV
jgi:hypothetical protein